MGAVLHVGPVGDVVARAERVVDLRAAQCRHTAGLGGEVGDVRVFHDEQAPWGDHGHHLVGVHGEVVRVAGEGAERVAEPGLLAVRAAQGLTTLRVDAAEDRYAGRARLDRHGQRDALVEDTGDEGALAEPGARRQSPLAHDAPDSPHSEPPLASSPLVFM